MDTAMTDTTTDTRPYTVKALLQLKYLRASLVIMPKNVPKNDIRHYLNGLHYDPRGYLEVTDGRRLLRMPASAAELTPASAAEISQAGHCIIPREDLEIFLSMVKVKTGSNFEPDIELTYTCSQPDAAGISIATTGKLQCGPIASHQFHPINGRYPDLDRVIPAPFKPRAAGYLRKGKTFVTIAEYDKLEWGDQKLCVPLYGAECLPSNFDASYLADFNKVAKELGWSGKSGNGFALQHGRGVHAAARVTFGNCERTLGIIMPIIV